MTTQASRQSWREPALSCCAMPCCVFSFIKRFKYMHAASGLFSWSMELLAFASRLLAPKMLDHLPHLSYRSILLCERRYAKRLVRTWYSVRLDYVLVRIMPFGVCSNYTGYEHTESVAVGTCGQQNQCGHRMYKRSVSPLVTQSSGPQKPLERHHHLMSTSTSHLEKKRRL